MFAVTMFMWCVHMVCSLEFMCVRCESVHAMCSESQISDCVLIAMTLIGCVSVTVFKRCVYCAGDQVMCSLCWCSGDVFTVLMFR